jgi:phosphatidylglycerol:prolipoprotein diacylglycerol transferase
MIFPHINPVFLDLGIIKIYWYGIAYMVGILSAWGISKKLLCAHHKNFPTTLMDDFIPYLVGGIIIGGRLGHAILYDQSLLTHPLELIAVWHGGMAFHGGLVGVICGILLFCHNKKVPILMVGDICGVVAPLGYFFGRLANFVNGELYGRETHQPWGMVFPTADHLHRHPSQLYEAFFEGLILFVALYIIAPKFIHRKGFLSGASLAGYGIMRYICEFFREPLDGVFLTKFGEITMGQIYTIPMVLAGIIFMLYGLNTKIKN